MSTGALEVVPLGGLGEFGMNLSRAARAVAIPSLEIDPDSSRVLFYARTSGVDPLVLHSAPLDGSTSPVPLAEATAFRLAPDGARVAYLSPLGELLSVPIDGSAAPVSLTGTIPPFASLRNVWLVPEFEVSADGARAVFVGDLQTDEVVELYSVPLDGSAPPVRVSAPLAAGEDVADFGIAPGSSRVAYRVNRGTYDLFGAPIDGSAPAIRLDQLVLFAAGYGSDLGVHGFLFTPDGEEVLYCASGGAALELFHAPLDGSSPPEAVNGPLVAGGNTLRYGGDPVYEITPDGGRVVYIADQDRDEDHELFETFLERRPRRSGAPGVR